MQDLERILKPGGALLVIDFGNNEQWTCASLRRRTGASPGMHGGFCVDIVREGHGWDEG
jgi:hypothetical protein